MTFQVAILNNETWLICGGRSFGDQAMFNEVMSRLIEMWGCPCRVVHGGANGADKMAGEWGERLALDVVAVHADWTKHGKAAGPFRNEDMLTNFKPKRVIAFPGGIGTADMVRRAKNRRGTIDVVEIRTPPLTPPDSKGAA